jgi:hypothetical protein
MEKQNGRLLPQDGADLESGEFNNYVNGRLNNNDHTITYGGYKRLPGF